MKPEEYQELLAGGCPWCGESLAVKTGKYGEFIACAEWCGYTKNIPGRGHYARKQPERKCSYDVCDGSGLIPFTKDEKVIEHTFTHCDCHPVYGVENADRRYAHALNLADFDFPMSDTFRGWSYEESGKRDPARQEITIELPSDQEDIDQLREQVAELHRKVQTQRPRIEPDGY